VHGLGLARSANERFAGARVFGWMDLRAGPRRTWWARFGALAIVVLLVFVPDQAQRIHSLSNALSRQETIQGDLADAIRDGVPCRPVAVANRRPIPLLALWVKTAPERIVDAQTKGVPNGATYIVPSTPEVARRYILDKRDRNRRYPPPPPGFMLVTSNSSWRVSADC